MFRRNVYMDSEIQSIFDNAQHIVFLTGAGVSTLQGFPIIVLKTGYIRHLKKANRRNII